MSTFEYPITEKYIRDWKPIDALRELGANAKDGDTLGGAMHITYEASKKRLVLKNDSTTLSRETLLLGGTDKDRDDRLIGTYGEGMKMAFLVLAREGFMVKVKNGREEVWIPKMEYSEKWESKILKLEVRKSKSQVESFEVEVLGVDLELWDEFQSIFLFMRDAKTKYSSRSAEILFDADMIGRIYVKGVFVQYRANFDHGYNFLNTELNRDRKIADDIDDDISQAWDEWLQGNSTEGAQIYDMLLKSNPESTALRYSRTPEIRNVVVAEFMRRHGSDTKIAQNTEQMEAFAHYGQPAVLITSDSLYQILSQRIQTLNAFQLTHKNDVAKTYVLDELTLEENDTYSKVLGQLRELGILKSPRISIVDFVDPKLRGVHRGTEILVSRGELKRRGKFMVTVVHEISHDEGYDGSSQHVNALQDALEKVIDRLIFPV